MRSLKDDTECKEIQRALESCNWNRKLAAVSLNISYKALLYKIKQHGLYPPVREAVSGLRHFDGARISDPREY